MVSPKRKKLSYIFMPQKIADYRNYIICYIINLFTERCGVRIQLHSRINVLVFPLSIYKFGYLSWHSDNSTAGYSMNRGWIPGRNKSFRLPHLQNIHTCSGGYLTFYSMDTGGYSKGYSGRSVKLTTHLHTGQNLRTNGPIPPLPYNAFMACEGKTLPFTPFISEAT